ncbi:matrix metalloproteinase-14-like [Anopheles nili]|uniref:matrix metalloproteinase-14-like n=1 Tax=Anopheles nili TaxID=185578 RepID=UPI00237AB19B|nr:matrix metalloproteinase-14-like [Anopheles nili]
MLQLCHMVTVAVTKPIGMEHRLSNEEKFRDFDDATLQYLMSFGYLEKSNIETGNLRTIDELESAVRNLQLFGGLKPTGTIDKETYELMKKPRCGAPDLSGSRDFLPSDDARLARMVDTVLHRSRRYIIQGQKWQNGIVTWR